MLAAGVSCANKYVKEEREKNTTFSTKCHKVSLKYKRDYFLITCLHNYIPKVVLYHEIVFTKVAFKSWVQVSILLELVIHVNNSR